ncbi:MAG TPA: SAM-dependent methyltransferase [Caldilineaceae bacterium]|nr:SAM-dependent methyltransferase [Caldilineaceae bacterium]
MSDLVPWSELPPLPAADIRIVGLGPGSLGDLTLAAWQALAGAQRVLLRTRRHPCVEHLARRLPIADCDDLYEQHAEFAEVYAAIVRRVLAQGREPGGVVYATPGHPWVGEATTRLILEQAREAGLTVAVIGGLSFVEPSFAALGVDLMDGSQVIDAMLLARQHHPQVEVGLPLLVGQLYARRLASDVKLTLMNAYPDDHPVTLVQAAGTPAQSLRQMPLYELDQHDGYDHLTCLYVPPLARGSFTDLQEIVAHLRAPEGCPWDREQTLESLRQDLLGECAEVLEAIDLETNLEDGERDRDNSAHIAEEIGDLYLVATMLVQIATEEGRFRMADVIHHIVTKLIRRHPHVFGDSDTATKAASVDQVLQNWDAIKAAEKTAQGRQREHPLAGIPAHLPALEKARRLQSKAAKAGLLDRAALAQARPALAALLGETAGEAAVGELLWQVVALAHQHGVNAEDALRSQVVAFRRRHGAE